jgi:dihydrofolate synthase/folylpolyglutamate synthase
MTYPEAIAFLYKLRWFGAKLGLRNTLRLAELAGNPHHGLRFIHVAGTNGKGSTCAMLESIYRRAGLRTGLFTSPHLVAFSERIQVNREPISEAEVVRQTAALQPILREFPTDEHPTFFEVVTVMAMKVFAERNCDLVLWETGLGGRLDATNIVNPLASVITNIQYDHQKWLGKTLASIAAEKAGIIKPGRPVVTAAESPEALEVILEAAKNQNAPLTRVSGADRDQPPLDRIRLPLPGEHQKLNAAAALATVRVLTDQLPVGDSDIVEGLERVHWPGRLQLVRRPNGREILLDGAHNVGGAEILARALQTEFKHTTPTLVLGILADKDWKEMCEILAPHAARILLVPVHSERTAQPDELASACRAVNPQAQIMCLPSLSAALERTGSDPFITVAGSLYLVGEAMEILKLCPEKAANERELNEWTTVGAQPVRGQEPVHQSKSEP